MGKYAKAPKTQKTQAIAGRQTKKKKKVGKGAKSKKTLVKKAITKVKGQAHEDKVDKTPALAAGGDEEMAAAPAAAAQDAATNQAGAKLVSFLSRAKTVNKLQAALQQILNRKQEPAALGAALVHCAGRGNGSCVSALLEAGAPVDARAPAAEGGHTALQLAASRGHVAACRMLVEAGADRAGAAEAAQALAKLGATFGEERRAIQALLR